MKKNLFMVFFVAGLLSVYANGQQEGASAADKFSDYRNWTKVNQNTITGDETGVLGPAHERARGFREIYINEIGKPVAYGASDYPYPEGSVILKESFSEKDGGKGKLASITIMIKREEGYDPDNGNWEYINASGDFKISRQGKIGMCIKCHSVMSEKDFTFWDSSL